jgi:hypothetical protein
MQSVPSWKKCPRASARYGPSTIRLCYRKPRHSGRARRCRSAVTLRNGRRGLDRSLSLGRPRVPRRMRNAMVQDASEIRGAVVAVHVLTLRTALPGSMPATPEGLRWSSRYSVELSRFLRSDTPRDQAQGQASGESRRKSEKVGESRTTCRKFKAKTLSLFAFLVCLKHQMGTISAAMRPYLPESSPS